MTFNWRKIFSLHKQEHKFLPQSAVVVIHDQLGAAVHGVPLSMTDSDNGARDESRQCTSHISIAHDENSNDQAASRDEPCTNRRCLHLLFCLFPDSSCGGIAWFVGQLSVNQSVNYKRSRQAKRQLELGPPSDRVDTAAYLDLDWWEISSPTVVCSQYRTNADTRYAVVGRRLVNKCGT